LSDVKLSVVIPTYNRSDHLRETLHGLTRQSLPRGSFEVIVSDDGSTDDTRAVAESFAEQLRLTYHFQEDLGFRVAAARNAGARLASAPVLVFIDTGAVVGPDYLRHHLAAHEASPVNRAVIGYAYAYRPEDPAPGLAEAIASMEPENVLRHYGYGPAIWDTRHGQFEDCDYDVNRRAVPWILFWGTNCSVRASDYWAVGGFDEDFRRWGVEDMEIGFRLFRHGVPFFVTRAGWVIEGAHERDMAGNMVTNKLNGRQLLEKFPEPMIEIGWAEIMNDDLWPWEGDYRALLAWSAECRDRDVADEIAAALDGVAPGARVAVLGCGTRVPESLSGAQLADFDAEVLAKAAGDGHHTGHHAIGIRTVLPDDAVDVVVVTSRLRGLWERWGAHITAEAHRVGADVRLPAWAGR